jgi:hypothetical protein
MYRRKGGRAGQRPHALLELAHDAASFLGSVHALLHVEQAVHAGAEGRVVDVQRESGTPAC